MAMPGSGEGIEPVWPAWRVTPCDRFRLNSALGRLVRDEVVRDRGYHPGLDGVRGVAILLVLGQHAPTRPLIDGFVGVTVFFCLSGYLITTLLVRQLQTGTIDVAAFYRRRAARLFPGLLAVVAATTVVLLIGRRDLSA